MFCLSKTVSEKILDLLACQFVQVCRKFGTPLTNQHGASGYHAPLASPFWSCTSGELSPGAGSESPAHNLAEFEILSMFSAHPEQPAPEAAFQPPATVLGIAATRTGCERQHCAGGAGGAAAILTVFERQHGAGGAARDSPEQLATRPGSARQHP